MGIQAVGIGTGVADMLLNIDKLPGYNENANLLMQSNQYGGKVATAMAAVGRLGMECAIIGVIGDDVWGHAQLRDYARSGVNTEHQIIDPNGGTILSVVLSDREGSRNFLGNGNPNKQRCRPLRVEDLDETMIRNAKGRLLDKDGDPQRAAAQWIRQSGGVVCFDADVYTEGRESMIPYTDAFIPSEFYYKERYGEGTPVEDALRDIVSRGAKTAIITLGERGLVGLSQGEFFTLPAFSVDVVDTTGAGDVFHGAYLYGMIKGFSVVECARFASAVSAIKCSSIGGRSALPTYEIAKEFMETGRLDRGWIDERVRYYMQPFEMQK